MNNIIKLNIGTIFFPIQSIRERIDQPNQLKETILFLWPIYLCHIFFELLMYFYNENFSALGWSALLIIFKGFLFPFFLLIDCYFQYFVLRIFFDKNISDVEIDAVVGNSIAGGVFFLIPLVGEIVSFIASKVLIFISAKQYCGWINAICICSFPFLLSIFFIVFLILCLALFSMTLVALF